MPHMDSNGNVTTQEYNPVYDISQRPKQLVAGIQIELMVRNIYEIYLRQTFSGGTDHCIDGGLYRVHRPPLQLLEEESPCEGP